MWRIEARIHSSDSPFRVEGFGFGIGALAGFQFSRWVSGGVSARRPLGVVGVGGFFMFFVHRCSWLVCLRNVAASSVASRPLRSVPEVSQFVAEFPRIVYISCNPQTLREDLAARRAQLTWCPRSVWLDEADSCQHSDPFALVRQASVAELSSLCFSRQTPRISEISESLPSYSTRHAHLTCPS